MDKKTMEQQKAALRLVKQHFDENLEEIAAKWIANDRALDYPSLRIETKIKKT